MESSYLITSRSIVILRKDTYKSVDGPVFGQDLIKARYRCKENDSVRYLPFLEDCNRLTYLLTVIKEGCPCGCGGILWLNKDDQLFVWGNKLTTLQAVVSKGRGLRLLSHLVSASPNINYPPLGTVIPAY